MKNPDPLEKDIEHQVCDHAKQLGCYVRKFTSPAQRSVPDRIYISPSGVVWFIEFKKKGKVSTAAQALEQEKIRKHNIEVFVVDNVEEGKSYINAMVRDPMF